MSLRDIERESIRGFLEDHANAGTFSGQLVLDYGAGKSPYRALIKDGGGDYLSYDSPEYGGYVGDGGSDVDLGYVESHSFDVIVTTQTWQYMGDPLNEMRFLRSRLHEWGVLLATVPGCWPWIEKDDLWRFTLSGVERLLKNAGFSRVSAQERAHVNFEGERWPIGWQATARP